MKQSFQGGDLDRFDKFLSKQKNHNSNFIVKSHGLSKIVEFKSGIKFRFFNNDKKNIIKGSYFVNLVKKQIDKYIRTNGIVECFEKPQIQNFNLKALKGIKNKEVVCIDINSCFWRTAFLLNYIDEDLYLKGIERGFKAGLLVSIGALNKLPYIEEYKNGEVKKEYYDRKYNNTYSPFYWSIICRVRDIMMESYHILQDDFYMWLTDCAFINKNRLKDLEKVFNKYGYNYKTYTSKIIKCDLTTVDWFDKQKQKFKSITISNRNIDDNYLKWKIINN